MNSFSKESLPRRPRLLSLSLQTLGLNLDISLHLQCSFPKPCPATARGICDPYHQYQPDFFHTTIPLFFDRSGELDEEVSRWPAGIPKSPDSPKKFMDLLAGGFTRWA